MQRLMKSTMQDIVKRVFLAFPLAALGLIAALLAPQSIHFSPDGLLPEWAGASAEEKEKLTKADREARLKYKDGIKARRRQALSAPCVKKFEAYQEAISAEPPDYKSAEKALRDGFQRSCKPGFEHSELNRALGYVVYAQDRYKEAIQIYLASVNEPEADPQKRTNTRYTVAQLMYLTEDYKGSVEQMEQWLKEVEVVDKGGKILLARGYHALDNKDRALELVEGVMAEARAEDLVPRESWLNFQWVLYYEKNEYRKAVNVNRELLTHYPKIKYWKQLSAMYGSLEDPLRETIALDLTYQQNGLDKEKQYVALAYQYMALDAPYKGAVVLDKAIKEGKVEATEKNLSVLGSAYQRAREFSKASPVMEQAAKLSDDGNAYSRLASIYLNLNENEKALLAARSALQKGKLKREDLTWMSRGSAEAALHCYDAAAKSFGRAAKFEKTKKSANNWKTYVQNEGDRRKNLIANGAKLARCKKV